MNLRRWLLGMLLVAGVALAIDQVRGADKSPATAPATATASSDAIVASPVAKPIDRSVTRSGKTPAKADALVMSYNDDPEHGQSGHLERHGEPGVHAVGL